MGGVRLEMIRIAFAVLLFLHGIVHVLGFVVPWRLVTNQDLAYTTTVLWGAVDVGDAGARLVGLVMLALAIVLPVAAAGIVLRRRWALPLATAGTLVSLVACALDAPAAIIGLALNVAILAVLLVALSARRHDAAGTRVAYR